jgi:pSer/pThr/pTyr-binding forkhead associated (FHA) protein
VDLRLPAQNREPLPRGALQVVEAIERATGTGYIEARFDDGERQLLLFKGDKVWCAGALSAPAGKPMPSGRSVARFFAELDGADEVSRCEVDLPLFLCLGVLFRKAPAAQIPTALVDSEKLLQGLAETGDDAVLAIERGGAVSLVFCREGAPAALYPAEGEAFAEDGAVADRIVEYLLTSEQPVQLVVFDEIRLPPAEDGGPIDQVTERADLERERAAILVRLGERVAFRYPVLKPTVLVGRGEDADLALDNLSVSRRHCALHVAEDGGVVVEDLESENGVLVGGNRVQRAALGVGDAAEVGKYSLEVIETSSELHKSKLPRPARPPGVTGEKTFATTESAAPVLVHDDEAHKITGLVFSIGSGESANLQLSSLFVADLHAVLRRDAEGRWAVKHLGGLRSVKVNGERVKERTLEDGDEIQVAGERLVFRLPA